MSRWLDHTSLIELMELVHDVKALSTCKLKPMYASGGNAMVDVAFQVERGSAIGADRSTDQRSPSISGVGGREKICYDS